MKLLSKEQYAKKALKELNFKALNQCAIEGLIPDDQNPIFVCSGISNKFLIDIINGKLDFKSIARYELMNRCVKI